MELPPESGEYLLKQARKEVAHLELLQLRGVDFSAGAEIWTDACELDVPFGISTVAEDEARAKFVYLALKLWQDR